MLPCCPGSGPYRAGGGEGRGVLCDVSYISGVFSLPVASGLSCVLCY
jgi:hypothetical protein